ncbi:MAG: OsmC family protein [bacterium]
MSEHRALVHWEHAGGPFIKRQYSRAHQWTFDGGIKVPASSSPAIVPPPFGDPTAVDPEEAFVAAIASCHMLTFLWLAAAENVDVVRYRDHAVGHMTPNERGVPWVSTVHLSPSVQYAQGRAPTAEHEADLHHRAHDGCYIANSVRTEIRVTSAADALANHTP